MSGLRSGACTGLRACRSRRSPGSWGSRRTRCAGRCGLRKFPGTSVRRRARSPTMPSRRSGSSWRCARRCRRRWSRSGSAGTGRSRCCGGRSGGCGRVALPQDPAGRTSYEPGGLVQDDFWFPPAEIPLGHGTVASGDEVPPVLVMASGYSRWMLGLMIPSRHAEDLVLGTWRLLQQLGGVARQRGWGNEGGGGKFRGFGRAPALSRQFAGLRGLLGCEVVVLPRREPEHKGIVERNNDYLETSFLPGRSFASPADFNAQMGEWMLLANSRRKRVLGCAPADRIDADRAAMAPLPPIAESSLGWHNRIRLPRDHYVRIDTCDYSVDPAVIGRMVDVRADLGQVTVTCEGRLAACHDRSWVAHQTVTDPAHKAAADGMRAERMRAKLAAPAAAVEVEQRDLSRYDALLGGGEVA